MRDKAAQSEERLRTAAEEEEEEEGWKEGWRREKESVG